MKTLEQTILVVATLNLSLHWIIVFINNWELVPIHKTQIRGERSPYFCGRFFRATCSKNQKKYLTAKAFICPNYSCFTALHFVKIHVLWLLRTEILQFTGASFPIFSTTHRFCASAICSGVSSVSSLSSVSRAWVSPCEVASASHL